VKIKDWGSFPFPPLLPLRRPRRRIGPTRVSAPGDTSPLDYTKPSAAASLTPPDHRGRGCLAQHTTPNPGQCAPLPPHWSRSRLGHGAWRRQAVAPHPSQALAVPPSPPLSSSQLGPDPARALRFSPTSAEIQVVEYLFRQRARQIWRRRNPANARPCDATRVMAPPTFLLTSMHLLAVRQAAAHSKAGWCPLPSNHKVRCLPLPAYPGPSHASCSFLLVPLQGYTLMCLGSRISYTRCLSLHPGYLWWRPASGYFALDSIILKTCFVLMQSQTDRVALHWVTASTGTSGRML